MVEPSGCIKLIDFGCARAFRDESSTVIQLYFCEICFPYVLSADAYCSLVTRSSQCYASL